MATILTFPTKNDASVIRQKAVAHNAGVNSTPARSARDADAISSQSHSPSESAEIIIFPGVRIEHIEKEVSSVPQKSKSAFSYLSCGIDISAN